MMKEDDTSTMKQQKLAQLTDKLEELNSQTANVIEQGELNSEEYSRLRGLGYSNTNPSDNIVLEPIIRKDICFKYDHSSLSYQKELTEKQKAQLHKSDAKPQSHPTALPVTSKPTNTQHAGNNNDSDSDDGLMDIIRGDAVFSKAWNVLNNKYD